MKWNVERGAYDDETLKDAVSALEEYRRRQFVVYETTFIRTLRRHRDSRFATRVLALGPKKPAVPNTAECILREHISYMEKCLHVLINIDVVRLAYDLAEKLGLKHNFFAETKIWNTTCCVVSSNGRRPINPATTGHQHCAGCGFNQPKVHQFFELYRS